MLTFDNVSKRYKDFEAVKEINLELTEGIYGFLSPNGAGKTTLLKMAATLLNPTSGEIYYNGESIKQMGERYRELLGYMPQQFGYYKDYSAKRFLQYIAALKGLDRKTSKGLIDELLDKVDLGEVRNDKLKTFSGGMLQRVGIAQAMLGDPKLLILDEPTAGLDPKERAKFRDILKHFSDGRIVLYSTHIVSDIESIADRIIMLKDHTLFCNLTIDEMMREYGNEENVMTLEEIFLKIYEET